MNCIQLYGCAAFCFVLVACVSIDQHVNRSIDPSLATQFQPGITTASDVQFVYGPPERTITNSQNGHLALVYASTHVAGQVFGSAQVSSQLVLFIFDANGRFLSYRTSQSEDDIGMGVSTRKGEHR